MRTARFSAPAGGPDDEATVTARGRTLEALSRNIAATVQSLAQPGPADACSRLSTPFSTMSAPEGASTRPTRAGDRRVWLCMTLHKGAFATPICRS